MGSSAEITSRGSTRKSTTKDPPLRIVSCFLRASTPIPFVSLPLSPPLSQSFVIDPADFYAKAPRRLLRSATAPAIRRSVSLSIHTPLSSSPSSSPSSLGVLGSCFGAACVLLGFAIRRGEAGPLIFFVASSERDWSSAEFWFLLYISEGARLGKWGSSVLYWGSAGSESEFLSVSWSGTTSSYTSSPTMLRFVPSLLRMLVLNIVADCFDRLVE